jgi:hypothetical protein
MLRILPKSNTRISGFLVSEVNFESRKPELSIQPNSKCILLVSILECGFLVVFVKDSNVLLQKMCNISLKTRYFIVQSRIECKKSIQTFSKHVKDSG